LQAIPHMPPWQIAEPLAGGGQTLLHPPQFCASFDGLRHWLPQARKPGSHEKPQTPVVHLAVPCAGAPQPAPQDEQLFASLWRSVHWPPQLVWPEGQEDVHIPAEQTWPELHAMPQPPQLLGSEARITQALPHLT
jgi:hypothetical protein